MKKCALIITVLTLIFFSSCSQTNTAEDKSMNGALEESTQAVSLPDPTHTMLLGYYFVDGKYGTYWDDVSCYTNFYLGGMYNYDSYSELPEQERIARWKPLLRNSLAGAVSRGYQILLATPFNNEAETDGVLEVAKEFWNNVAYLEIGHEVDWTSSANINSRIKKITDKLDTLGLPHPRLGATYGNLVTEDQGNGIKGSNLDWIGVEAYIGPPESSLNSCDNIAALNINVNPSVSYYQSTVTFPAGRTYCWKVKSLFGNTPGAWSRIVCFTVN